MAKSDVVSVREAIEQRLQKAQANKKFKDTDTIQEAKKYKAAFDIVSAQNLDEVEQTSTPEKYVIKDKVFPKIDIEAERAKGTTSGATYLKKQLRDAFPAKPDYKDSKENAELKRKIFVELAESMFANLESVKNVNDFYDFTKKYTKEYLREGNGVTVYKADAIVDGKKATLVAKYYRGSEFEKIGAKELWNFLERKTEIQSDKYRKASFDEQRNDWSWVEGTPKENKEPQEGGKFKPEFGINRGMPLTHIIRKNGLEIPSIEVENVKKIFGFSKVGFGNYVKDIEAQEHIKHFLGASTDLFDALGMDMSQVNKLGGLSLGFGLTGSGKALATYNRATKLINITKRRGDGTLAHEWGHYFDNLIFELDSNMSNLMEDKKMASDNYVHLKNERMKKAVQDLMQYIYKGGQASEVEETYNPDPKEKRRLKMPAKDAQSAIEYMQKFYPNYFDASKAPRNAKDTFIVIASQFNTPITIKIKLGKTNFLYWSEQAGDYWKKDVELWARAWETYIFEALKRKGLYNNYLVNDEFFELDNQSKVYPEGEERTEIVRLFDNIISTFKDLHDIKPFTPFTNNRITEDIDLEADTPEPQTTKKDLSYLAKDRANRLYQL